MFPDRYDRSVFINCPYDPGYEPIKRAIIFAIVAHGFVPRSAVETRTVATPRMQRIAECVLSCRYSIHDLSRSRGEGQDNYARFNMPLELGIVLGRNLFARDENERNDWLVLVRGGDEYARLVSDLAGFDPEAYDCTPDDVIPRVIGWLQTRPTAEPGGPTPHRVRQLLPHFTAAYEQLCVEWMSEVPWHALVEAAALSAAPLLQSSVTAAAAGVVS